MADPDRDGVVTRLLPWLIALASVPAIAGAQQDTAGLRLVVQTGHRGAINSVAVAPSGALLTASSDHTVAAWDTSGRQVRQSATHGEPVVAAVWLPGGGSASVSRSRLVVTDISGARVHDGNWGLAPYAVFGPTGGAALAVDPRGRFLAVSSETRVYLHDLGALTTRRQVHEPGWLGDYQPSVPVMTFTPDGSMLLCVEDEAIQFWDPVAMRRVRSIETASRITALAFVTATEFVTASGRGLELRSLEGPDSAVVRLEAGAHVTALASAPSLDLLAVARDTTIALWDTRRRAVTGRLTAWAPVTSLALTADGTGLVAGTSDGYALKWSLPDGTITEVFASRVDAPQAVVTTTGLTFVSARGGVWRWDVNRQRLDLMDHSRVVRSLATSPDGSTIASGSTDSTVRVWNPVTGEPVASLRHSEPVQAIALDDSGRVAIAGDLPDVVIWRFSTGRQPPGRDSLLWLRERGSVRSLQFSADGRTLLAATDSGITIWDLTRCRGRAANGYHRCDSSRPKLFSGEFERRFHQVARFSPNGRYVMAASIGQDSSLQLWDTHANEHVRNYDGPWNGATALTFHPVGDWFFVGGYNGVISEVALHGGRVLRNFAGVSGSILDIGVSQDTTLLFAAASDGLTHVWDLRSAQHLGTLAVRAPAEAGQVPAWTLIAPDGRFDTNGFGVVDNVLWQSSADPLGVLPLESFMREYYTPRWFARQRSGEQLPPVRPPAARNQAVPAVDARILGLASTTDEVLAGSPVRLRVRVEASAVSAAPAHDIRLFRDGQLVGQCPGSSCEFAVAIPRRSQVDTIELSAYAFNEDRVKGPTSVRLQPLPALTPAPRRAWIVSVGVSANDAFEYTLTSASLEADRIAGTFASAVTASEEFASVETIRLISSRPGQGAVARRQLVPVAAGDALPTRANILAVLGLLAGRPTGDSILPAALMQRLAPARPGDLVVVSFTMHGLHDEARGEFVLLPQDATLPGHAPGAFPRAIAASELADVMRHLDAGTIALLLSTCYSTSAVAPAGFRAGPMGEAGFGQLAYDKGMMILAAAEARATGLGELTVLGRALLESAENMRQRGGGPLGELLRAAERRAPQLAQGSRGPDMQVPMLFDFRRKRSDALLYGKR